MKHRGVKKSCATPGAAPLVPPGPRRPDTAPVLSCNEEEAWRGRWLITEAAEPPGASLWVSLPFESSLQRFLGPQFLAVPT